MVVLPSTILFRLGAPKIICSKFDKKMARLVVCFGLRFLVCVKLLSDGKGLPWCSCLIDNRVFWNVLRYSVIHDNSYTRVVLINWNNSS